MISEIDVYNKIKTALGTSFSNVYCSSAREPVPESFPAMYLYSINQYRERNAIDLSFSDKQKRFIMQAECYSNLHNGAKLEANKLMDAVENAFNGSMFYCTFRENVDNIDPSVYRVIARFERVIGEDDTL